VPYLIRILLSLVLPLVLLGGFGAAGAATDSSSDQQDPALSAERLESLVDRLEDPKQRDQLIESLRTLLQAEQQKAEAEPASVKTAAAEALELVATKLAVLGKSASGLLDAVAQSPRIFRDWGQALLRDPAVRQRWLLIGGRVLAVLAAGFLAAALVAWLTRGLKRRVQGTGEHYSLTSRLLRLGGHLIIDLLPILVFAFAAYTTLTLVDPRQETRLVAVALINASILSRLVLAVAAFLFAPESPSLRLWRFGDETAQYAQHWVKRLSLIAIYGFFGLQAALLLGLDFGGYQTLLRLLGLVVLGLLLVLIAQNRDDVGEAIAGQRDGGQDEPPQLSALRRGLGRVWHLAAGLYLLIAYAIWALQIENGAEFVAKASLLTLLVFAATLLLLRATDRLFEQGLQLSEELRARLPGLEQRLNRYFPALRKGAKLLLVGFAALLVADAWGVDALTWITEGSGRLLIGALLNILLILVVALFLWELASGTIERYLATVDPAGNTRARSARTRTLLTVARNALMVVLTLVSTLMVLSEIGINIAPLLAGAGVVGLAIGFGSQRLVQDVINGVFILFQDLMSVGDVVKLGDKAGVVEALSIRTVRLRDLSGTVHTIPFSAIEGVSNLTRDFSFYVFDLGIAYREDVDAVIALLQQIGEELRDDAELGPLILEPLEVFGLDAFGDSAIMIKGRIKTRPIKQWQVGRAFNRLVKLRFDERGIEIPFPHRTLYFGQDKDGSAPPAFVQLETLLREAGEERGVPG
jgi:small conductance mechanosensitive channel